MSITFVTGASSGIGRAFAAHAGRAGATVVLVSRREPELAALAAEIVGAGGSAIVHPADLTVDDERTALVEIEAAVHGTAHE